MATIRTCQQWIQQLAHRSAVIADMSLDKRIKDADLVKDAFNLANHEEHTRLVVRAVENLLLAQASSLENVTILLADIISRDTYGKFSELAAYEWLLRCDLKLTTQVAVPSTEVLGRNDTVLDGLIDVLGIHFDIKAFGLHGRLADRLKERLERELAGERVLVENSWDLAVDQFSELIADAPKIAAELRQKRFKHFGPLHIRIEPPRPVSVSSRTLSPYLLAKENASYPFRSADQFTTKAPFILIFVVHPWLNQSAIFNDFGGADTTFTRALARRAFMQFTHDSQPLNSLCKKVGGEVTFSDAAKLLSAIFFLNVWPEDADLARRTMPSCIYLNPRASHPLSHGQATLFRPANTDVLVENFAYDDY